MDPEKIYLNYHAPIWVTFYCQFQRIEGYINLKVYCHETAYMYFKFPVFFRLRYFYSSHLIFG